MNDKNKPKGVARREFLRDVGVGSAAGVAAVAIGSGPAVAKQENADERKKARYRESDHVKTYYKTNRY
jgi:hypothetical protein